MYVCICLKLHRFVKHWHVLLTGEFKIQKNFRESTIIAYRWNKNVKQIIASNSSEHNKKISKKEILQLSPFLPSSRAVL